MKYYVAGVLLLILISGCIKISSNPTGGVVVSDIPEEKPAEQPQQQPETAAETDIAPVQTAPQENEENITIEEPENPNVKVVEIRDLKLYPKELKIEVGNTVVWKHKDRFQDRPDIRHQIAHFYNKFRSPVLYYGGSFNYTFTQSGEYGYVDVVFKDKDDLRGKIIVE